MRHLARYQAVAALRRGKPIEQLLGGDAAGGKRTVRWVGVEPERDEFVLHVHHVYDPGEPDFRDLYTFAPVDANEYAGEGVVVARGADPDPVLDAARGLGATDERWVNFGVLADEYADHHGWS